MASRSTKYTSLLSRCLLPDNSQRVIHNQSPRWFEAPPQMGAENFSNGLENRGQSQIHEDRLFRCIQIAVYVW